MTDFQYLEKVEKMILQTDGNEAANAIRTCISTLINYEICSLEVFLCMIDKRWEKWWPFIADQIAFNAEADIRSGALHPNQIKPWHNCQDYKEKFGKLYRHKEWRELHAALDAINKSIRTRFGN